jgi:hypothetical protein
LQLTWELQVKQTQDDISDHGAAILNHQDEIKKISAQSQQALDLSRDLKTYIDAQIKSVQ